jgi:hypothetical protein
MLTNEIKKEDAVMASSFFFAVAMTNSILE